MTDSGVSIPVSRTSYSLPGEVWPAPGPGARDDLEDLDLDRVTVDRPSDRCGFVAGRFLLDRGGGLDREIDLVQVAGDRSRQSQGRGESNQARPEHRETLRGSRQGAVMRRTALASRFASPSNASFRNLEVAVSDQSQQIDAQQLADAVKGMSDDEVKESIKTMGIDDTMKNIFQGMQDAFKPEKASGVNCVIQYEIETEEGTKTWKVEIADGKCTTSEGAGTDPRLTLKLGLVDFVRLILGQADGPQLFMTGKLKLQGDMMFAMQMQGFFEQPS